MFRRQILGCVLAAVSLLSATACGPPPTAANTDTLDLGVVGRWSSPDVPISAEVSTSYSPRGPRSTVLSVTAGTGDAAVTFSMREENVMGPITPATVGDFPGVFQPPHVRFFGITRPDRSPSDSTLIGDVTIHEIELDPYVTGPGPTSPVIRLRASVTLSLERSGIVRGYLTIG